MSNTLHVEPVTNLAQAMELKRLRNGVRSFMTHDQRLLNDHDQLAWYEYQYMPRYHEGKMVAFLGSIGTKPVSFGIINEKDDKFWLTGGVAEAERGRGYGEQMFSYLTDFTLANMADEVWLDVFESNDRAKTLYAKLGFQAVEASETLIIMVKTNE